MSNKIKDLREQRGKLIADARAIVDKADAEKRNLSTDERGQYDRLMNDERSVAQRIKDEERLIEAEREAASSATPAGREKATAGEESRAKEIREAITGYIRGDVSINEIRALSVGLAAEGGYLVMPEQFVAALIKDVDNAVFIRSKATVHPLTEAVSLGMPYLSADPDDSDWTTELQTGSEDSSMAFGKRVLQPHPFAKRIKVSNDLLRLSAIGPEALVRARLAYKFAVTEEKGYMTGNGNQRPLGLFTASNDGIPTSRDVSSGNTTTAFTFDGLINTKYSVKAQYQKSGEWVFHRDAVKMLAKLKDGEGQYIWQASKTLADPDMLLGRPVNESEYAPNTFTTGLYVGLFGDLNHYHIADVSAVDIKRLNELYAETNQVGFIGRRAADGMPVLSEAFARVTLA